MNCRYNVIILLVTYMLPIFSMIYTYFRVGKELWGSQSIGECTAKQMESIKSKRKVLLLFIRIIQQYFRSSKRTIVWLIFVCLVQIVKMMMMVVAIFGVSILLVKLVYSNKIFVSFYSYRVLVWKELALYLSLLYCAIS